MKIILVTNNTYKIKEIKTILSSYSNQIFSYQDIIKQPLTIVEDGDSFKSNAVKKIMALPQISQTQNAIILSDDSGLEVESLNNRPGIHSARYGGENLSDMQRCQLLLNELKDKASRKAQLICVIALKRPNQPIITVSGKISGHITQTLSGNSGFGYDPIFIPTHYSQTLAELGYKVKNKISHRTKALKKATAIIKALSRNA
tara:strand:+ start:1533 stop:2138 length:606 start_codon:yes stop_codon:yes gene_type:complete